MGRGCCDPYGAAVVEMDAIDVTPASLAFLAHAGDQCIHAIFSDIARRNPDSIAIETPQGNWSYAALDRRSNLIANRLKASGVKRGELVGSCLLRSPFAIASFLGILKAGGAYVPFDLSYPPARLRFMLRDSGVRILLTDDAGAFKLTGLVDENCILFDPAKLSEQDLSLDSHADAPCGGRDLAYVMYTSGSTGVPKGALIEHRGVVRLVRQPDYVDLSADEVFLQLSPLSFDASTFEIWGALLNGARLVIPSSEALSLAEISDVIRERRVTTLWLTSGLFNAMVDEHPEAFAGVRQLLAGGDVLSVDHVRKAMRAMKSGSVINGYGPTENTTFTCCHRVQERDWERTNIPIGRPISQTRVYILNSGQHPVAAGEVGELYIGGSGLARGYWNQPELTEQKFVPDPFSPNEDERLYRSGDLVRTNADGEIEFVGRLDRQVKVRGCRVELDEIEAALDGLPGLSGCAVVAKGESADRKYLCCYFASGPGAELSPEAVADHLRRKLPAYSVPDEFCVLDELPLDPNGKIDRRTLSEMSIAEKASTTPAGAPLDPLEAELLQIWRELFGRPQIGLDDDFFQLGGHSLLAARLFAQINQRFGRRIPLAAMYELSTVRRLAAAVRDESVTRTVSSCIQFRTGPGRTLILVRHPGANVLNYRELAIRLADYTVYGLQPLDLDASELGAESLAELAAKYNRALRATQPSGPYWLGGYCAGGQIAYEMARQLQSEGEIVEQLALFDAMGEPESHELALAGRWIQVLARSSRIVTWKATHSGIYAARTELRQLMADLKLALSRISASKIEAPKTVAEAFEAMRPEYTREKYRGHVLLFRTEESREYSGAPDFGWRDLVAGKIEVCDIPGDHEFILDMPQVEVFAQELADALKRNQVQ